MKENRGMSTKIVNIKEYSSKEVGLLVQVVLTELMLIFAIINMISDAFMPAFYAIVTMIMFTMAYNNVKIYDIYLCNSRFICSYYNTCGVCILMELKYSILFDYYGELFTDKQKEYFTDYYFNNLTLQEIADNNNVSRNAVHKNIKDILQKLDYYEDKLNLYSNKLKIEKLIENIDVDIKKRIEELI